MSAWIFLLGSVAAPTWAAGAAELPTWRVEGMVENWTISTVPEAPLRENPRTTLFRLDFSEGGQWSIQTRSSVDGFRSLREVGCQRGDLFQIMHDTPGRVVIRGASETYNDAAYVCPGPIAFFTSQIGAVWWLFCAKHAFQGESGFSAPDFIGFSEGGSVYCALTPQPGELGLRGGELFSRPPQVNDFPAYEWRIEKRASVEGRAYPEKAVLQHWIRGSGFAPQIAGIHSVTCTNLTRVERPLSFRPPLRPRSWVMDERLAYWRVEYLAGEWLGTAELQNRLRLGQELKADYLGPQPLPPRVSSPFVF